ncbi:MAG: ATP-binding protein, partial [Candidatus Eisenbacteria bacterium]
VPVRGRDEIATLAAGFNALVDAIDRGERLRRNLVTDVAHELRTPVTNLRAQVEAIEDGLLAPSADTLASLREEIVLLTRLIDELQELSLADAGALVLAREAVALERAAGAALAAIAARAEAAGVTLACEVPPLAAVDADPARLAQILRNLLDNALRHTPRGGRVTISACTLGPGAEVSIRDTGEGIAPEHLPHVFERLYRADPSRDRRTGGAGLGLSVVRRLVEAHGGGASIESLPGEGTTARFTLPFAALPS